MSTHKYAPNANGTEPGTDKHSLSKKEGRRKRKHIEIASAQHTLPETTKHRTEKSLKDTTILNARPLAESADTSPFQLQTRSLYLPLSPISQLYPLQGLCAEHLSPLILTYYPPFHGVVVSYSEPRLSSEPDSRGSSADDTRVLAISVDEYAVSFVWVTADFLIFSPRSGSVIEGWINLQNEGHLGLVCWNLFNASIERSRLPKSWKWVGPAINGSRYQKHPKKAAGIESAQEAETVATEDDEGHYEGQDGKRIEGAVQFVVRDVEISPSSDRDRDYFSIEGTMLSSKEEVVLQGKSSSGARDRGRRRGLSAKGDLGNREAEHWGLEDYVVEVKGFECLHFADLCQILKEDEEVTIRPLQTIDLRCRKICGRHQISADGKHLIDGVAFGRPFLRKVDRPPIRIPPRKRLRLDYGNNHREEYQMLQENGRPSIDITDDTENENDDEEQDDGDFDPEILQNPDLGRGLHDISRKRQRLIDFVENDARLVDPKPKKRRFTRSQKVNLGLGIRSEGELLLVDDNGKPYPAEYHNPLLDYYDRVEDVDCRHSTGRRPKTTRSSPLSRRGKRKSKFQESPSRRSSTGSTKSVRFKENGVETPNTILEIEGSSRCNDKDIAPRDTVSPSSNKENQAPQVSSSESSEDTDLSTSYVSNSDSDSDLDSESEFGTDNHFDRSESSRTSSSGSSAQSKSKIASNAVRQRLSLLAEPLGTTTKSVPYKPSTNVDPRTSANRTVPPGSGQKHTQKRNQRRRNQKRMEALKRNGKLPVNATVIDLMKWDEDHQGPETTADPSLTTNTQVPQFDLTKAFESSRQQSLASIETRTVEPKAGKSPVGTESNENEPAGDMLPSSGNDTYGGPSATDRVEAVQPTPVTEPAKKRAKLDLASSRRLLFGSLGLRTPKNKLEEVELREKLMENAKPLKPALAAKATIETSNTTSQVHQDREPWQHKIILEAVECCQDGIELSQPPFPFLQRWDPQQKGEGKTRRRRQLQKHRADEISEYSSGMYPENLEEGLDREIQEPRSSESGRYQDAVSAQLLRDVNAASVEGNNHREGHDLPDLPFDITSLPLLSLETSLPGAIIAFQQLDMSQYTDWQPKVSEYRTASIEKNKGGILAMILAHRDRLTGKKCYDKETGERMYSKFEMPDFDDGDTEEDDGFVELMFNELIEPRLVRASDNQLEPATEGQDIHENVDEAGPSVRPEAEGAAHKYRRRNTSSVDSWSEKAVDEPSSIVPYRTDNVDFENSAASGKPIDITLAGMDTDSSRADCSTFNGFSSVAEESRRPIQTEQMNGSLLSLNPNDVNQPIGDFEVLPSLGESTETREASSKYTAVLPADASFEPVTRLPLRDFKPQLIGASLAEPRSVDDYGTVELGTDRETKAPAMENVNAPLVVLERPENEASTLSEMQTQSKTRSDPVDLINKDEESNYDGEHDDLYHITNDQPASNRMASPKVEGKAKRIAAGIGGKGRGRGRLTSAKAIVNSGGRTKLGKAT